MIDGLKVAIMISAISIGLVVIASVAYLLLAIMFPILYVLFSAIA